MIREQQRDVFRAREQFLADGRLPANVASRVRPEILASWRRSSLSGAEPTVDSCPHAADVNVEGSLYRAAAPVLTQLADRLSGLPAGVLLADRSARILRQWVTERSIIRELDRINSASGASASEEVIGTNGVGTVAELRTPQIVVGAEHFADMASGFLCVGAPIFHPLTRSFLGIVTLNSDANCTSPLLSALVMGTTQEIERRLLELSSRRERELLDVFLAAKRGGRPVAVVGDSVTLAGPQATRMLSGVDQTDLWIRVRADTADPRRERRIEIVGADGPLTLICTPVVVEAEVIGALVEVVEPARAHVRNRPAAALVPADWVAGRNLQRGRKSAGWLSAVRGATAHRDGSAPMLVLGEPGTGKLTVVQAMFGRVDERAPERLAPTEFAVLDCMTAAQAPGPWTESLRTALDGSDDSVVVLRHVDALDPDVAGQVSALLDVPGKPEAPRVVGTAQAADRWPRDAVFRRLLDQLGVGRLDLPALRECREDIPGLVEGFVARHCPAAPLSFSADAMRGLRQAFWPGNVRQLENVVRGLAETAPGRRITANLLPAELRGVLTTRRLTKLEQVEYDTIVATISQAGGNKVATARLLGISRSTLYRKMRNYHLDPDGTFG